MAQITPTGTTVTHDETAGLQNGGVAPIPAGDIDDDDVLFSSIPDLFSDRLEELNAGTALGAAESSGNVVTFSDITGTFNIALTDVDGNPLAGDDSGLVTTDGDSIFLFTDEENDNMVLGRTAEDGPIIFAIYLEETGGSPPTGAKLWTVQYEAIDHGDDNNDHDSAVDLTDLVYVNVSASQSFPFAGAPSGQNLFMMFGTTSQAILVTGEDPANESEAENVSNDGDSVNTGQGGGATTLGTEGQQIKPQKALVVTFVSGTDPTLLVPDLSPGEATDEAKISFTGYVLAQGAEFTISQMTPGNTNTTATVEIEAYKTLDAAGDSYIDNSPLVTNDAAIDITSVQVIRDGVNVVGTAGVDVTITDNTAVITGVKDDDIIRYTTDGDHNRVLIRNDQPDSGKGSNVAFDLGGFTITQDAGDTEEIGSKILFEDDGPTITVNNPVTAGTYAAGANGTWDHNPDTDGFTSLNINLDSYKIDDNTTVNIDLDLGTKTTTDPTTGNYIFTGSITDDFNGDGTDEKVDFTLTFDPDPENYTLAVTTPPSTVTTFDTSQGTLKAGGPDAVQTLLFGGTPPTEAGLDDIVFFGAVPTAPQSGVSGTSPPNDILDLVGSGATDLTETQIEALLPLPGLITPGTQMNVSTSGIGVNNNNLNGAVDTGETPAFAGTTITTGDESFVVNPETVVDKVTVFIDNSVAGYNPATEDLYFTVYYTDGSVSGPTDVTAAMLVPVTTGVAKGGVSFDIDGGTKQIDAVQLTMGVGTIKIPVIAFSVEQVFEPEPLQLNFTATLVDGDTDNQTDTFSVLLNP